MWKKTEIDILDDLDYLNPDTVDLADNTLTFYFTHYCEYLDEEGDECGHEFEIEVPVVITSEWVHVEQEECE